VYNEYLHVLTHKTPTALLVNVNKKLRYREEHSASTVLSWCTSRHFLGENLFMANQPLLCNRPQSYRVRQNNENDTTITPFKVIQGHQFCYQSKAHMRLPKAPFPSYGRLLMEFSLSIEGAH